MSFASISGVEILVVAAVWALILGLAAVTVAKGHIVLFFVGFFLTGIIWLIAAPRLAKPNSPWARRFYGPEKLERSRRRYRDIDPAQSSRAGLAAATGFGLLAVAFVAGVVAGVTGGT
jgi:hypothetical protein